ncbi:uncharacterized protein LOC131680603 [Topomyia yanbarensis]|uniref:uncharacterized protein LOC131680603 n=1 Tax=Topomyia yanbarensis TaxID=2498891 RepID=UPI00273B7EF2|nr:uncharacterized protein LOC131680603 [Topomyia yanbarensis]
MNATVEVTGVNGEAVGTIAGMVRLMISSRFDEKVKLATQAYVMGKLTATLPCQQFSASNMPHLEGLKLADPQFNKPSSVDVIMGADVFLSILQAGQVKGHNGIPVAQRSIFGWMVAGRISKQRCTHAHHKAVNLHQDVSIDRTLRLFWEEQELPNSKLWTEEEKGVIEHFNSTVTRSKEGRFIVRLPLDDSKLKLGGSLTAATKRRFQRDANFKQRYVSFMNEYRKLGHMELIPEAETDPDCTQSYYLPHHGIAKEDGLTTKLRVFFDGSRATTSGVALNDILLDAPNVNADLFEALLRFRSYPVVFAADVEKMYRQVLLHSEDTDYQRIVWRDSSDKPIQHFRLLTVTYGLKNSGFLAMSALKKAAEAYEQQYPTATERIKYHTYVDDLTSGAESEEEAIQLIQQINEILHRAGFVLRK